LYAPYKDKIVNNTEMFAIILLAYAFLLNNEGWTIVGNKNLEKARHQNYNLGQMMSSYIIGSDNLVNVDAFNRDDKNLWYFKSPMIQLEKEPKLMVFTITSFSGDFTKLNRDIPVVKITTDDITLLFYQAEFNGRMQRVNVPFVKELWRSKTDFLFKPIFANPFSIEILGDWTQGIETIGIDNVEFY
jgi:hypothetical protein